MSDSFPRRAGVAFALAAFAAACGQSPASPTGVSPSLSPSSSLAVASAQSGDEGGRITLRAAGDVTASTVELGRLKICKAGNVSGTFTVTATPVSGGTPTVSSPITVAAGSCRTAAEDFDTGTGVGANITVTETSSGLQSIAAQRNDAGVISSFSYTNGGTVFLNNFHGYTITFTNNVTQTGTTGCTPGYWKNHTDSWPAPYTPSSGFNASFGIGTNWFSNSLTLLDAAGLNGGQEGALARHATAALLNAAAGISPLTTAQVIARVQATYAGTFGVEATKNYFAGFNELGCPLN
jgi:hypothetical protein